MRYAAVTLAAFALLFAAAWVSWGGNDGRMADGIPGRDGSWGAIRGILDVGLAGEVDADVTRLLRMLRPRPDIRVAGADVLVATEAQDAVGEGRLNKEVVDDNPYLEEALAYYGVEEFKDALIIVRFRESSNIQEPCVVGLLLERGPFQFLPSTWAGTPYAHLDPCDLEAATWAAAWFVSERRWLEWSTWPR